MHPVVQKIRDLIDQAGFVYTYFEHEPVVTSEEAAALRPEYGLHQGTKALIVRLKKAGERSFAMIIVPGDRKFDLKKARDILGVNDIRFANREEADQITDGVEFGGVPPFGNLFDIPVYVDDNVFDNEEIIFNCGDQRASIAMKSAEWRQIVEPIVVDIV